MNIFKEIIEITIETKNNLHKESYEGLFVMVVSPLFTLAILFILVPLSLYALFLAATKPFKKI
jgi:hypothetical protein